MSQHENIQGDSDRAVSKDRATCSHFETSSNLSENDQLDIAMSESAAELR
jgi:hypothetical protein